MGQLINEGDVIGHPPFSNLALEKFQQVVFADNGTGFLDHDEQWAFIPFRMNDSNHCRFCYIGVGEGKILQVNGTDPFAAGLNDVLRAIGNLHEAIGVDGGYIAGGEPAVRRKRIPTFTLKVFAHDPGATHQQIAEGFAVVG